MLTARFFLAAAASAVMVMSAPFIRDIRVWIRTLFPGHFAAVVGAAAAIAIATAVIIAVVRIRDRRAPRYGAIVLALIIGTAYAIWNAQGVTDVDVVERFHFIEFGLITLLFYRVWRPVGDASVVVLPLLAGLFVGTLDEWLQWFIPVRIGDMRDVFLNGIAIVCGLLFSLGLDPPERLSFELRPGSLRRIGVMTAVVTFAFASFVQSVHLGHEVDDPDAGRFRSRYDAATLAQIGQRRVQEWKIAPPLERPLRLMREDQYMSEGLQHVQLRNREWQSGNVAAAWSENAMLEKYYAPVLDTPSYVSATGHRWPAAQRADASQRYEASRSSGPSMYVSMADATEGAHFIRLWSPLRFWLIVLLMIGATMVVTVALDRGSGRSA